MSNSLHRINHCIWLRHTGQSTFHAYAGNQPGTRSVCGEPHEIAAHVAGHVTMESPVANSPICRKCFEELYDINLAVPNLDFNKPVPFGSIGAELSKIEEEILRAALEHITSSAANNGLDVEKTLGRVIGRLFRELMYLRYGNPAQS